MYAVIKTGGKQYKVAKDQIVIVEKLAGEAGDSVAFDQVLLVGEDDKTTLGAPFVAGASVTAEVVEQARADKIIVFKKKRRKNHRRRNGHRQHETVLRITEILTDGKAPAKAAKAKAKPKDEAKDEAAAEPTAKDEAAPKKAEPKAETAQPADKPAAKTAAPKAKTAKPKAEAEESGGGEAPAEKSSPEKTEE